MTKEMSKVAESLRELAESLKTPPIVKQADVPVKVAEVELDPSKVLDFLVFFGR